MICTNQTVVSAYPWTHWEKLTFDQGFVSKHQIFSFENCRLDNTRRSKVMGTFRKFLGWEVETFSDRSKTQTTTCNMAVIETNQWVSIEMAWLFNVALLFNVAPLDATYEHVYMRPEVHSNRFEISHTVTSHFITRYKFLNKGMT